MEQYVTLIFILSPLIKFLCNPDRKWNKRHRASGRYITYLLLICIIIFKMTKKDKNCYEILKIRPTAPNETLRKSFKTLAFSLHPDRNKDPASAAKYANLTEKYKFISSPDLKYKYSRFYDVIKREQRPIHDLTILDLIMFTMIRSLAGIVSTFFLLFTSGEFYLRHPLFLYTVFYFFLDLYLRLSDEEVFLKKLPVLRYYMTFEILTWLNEFKTFFMHYTTLFPREEYLTISVAYNMLKENLKALAQFNALLFKLRRFLPAKKADGSETLLKPEFKKDLEVANTKIKRLYKDDYYLKWSNDSKDKFKRLLLTTERLNRRMGLQVFSFLLTSGIILLKFMK